MDEIETEFSIAEARIASVLMMELIEALLVRGSIRREDIAGAILRTEYRAELTDDISGHLGEAAVQATGQWTTRFGLEPQLFHLRDLQHQWMMQGQKGKSPLSPAHIADRYEDEDEQDER